MTLTASEVVSQYLASRRSGYSGFAEMDTVIADATKQIVAEMPDGFSKRDVIKCVKALTAEAPELAEAKPYRRTLIAGKTLAAMVETDEIAENDGTYSHVAF